MKAPAHIAAGTTFTGVLCSIYDINIFQNWTSLSLCVFFSLLPDIDTTKTIIGKSFYPIAKFINRKFGHRTVTHSFLFLLFILAIFKSLAYFNIIENPDYTMIAVFAVLSHIILDMFTLSGVPFLYPFLRNSCVIPGNPDYRFKVGDLKSELIVTGVCGLLSFSMQPLFLNGFWTQYNRSFGTIKHVHRENNNTDSYILCDYSFIDNNTLHEGTAIVVESQTNEITLFDKGQIFVLDADDHTLKINYTRPRPSFIPKLYDYIQFFGIELDSLVSLMSGRLVTGLIQSNYNVEYIEKSIKYNTNFISLKNRFNFYINAMADSTIGRHTELAELHAVQEEERRRFNAEVARYNQYRQQLNDLNDALSQTDLTNYERNRLQNELIALRRRTVEMPVFQPSLRTQVRIDELTRSLSARNLQFSGYLTIYHIVDPSLPEVRQQYREIEDNYLAQNQQRQSVYNINTIE